MFCAFIDQTSVFSVQVFQNNPALDPVCTCEKFGTEQQCGL